MPGPGLISRLAALLAPRPRAASRQVSSTVRSSAQGIESRPSRGPRGTVEVPIDQIEGLSIRYAPQRNGAPDAGEVVWAWVPYQESPDEGKDRPVLVIGRKDAQRVWAVKLTSRSHDGERDYLHLGTGPWDSRGRESWVDIDQVYLVHVYGIRREAAALDRVRFSRVADVLHRRYGWTVEV